jgi:hypothetical protein
MTVGALFGLLMGLTFGGVIGSKWLDDVLRPGRDGEADEAALGPL